MAIKYSFLIKIISYVIPISFFIVIWFPIIDQYYISPIDITDEVVNQARIQPSDQIFDELNGKEFDFGLKKSFENDKKLITVAEKILKGNLEIPGYSPQKISIPFNPDDIDKGLPGWQLQLAGFVAPEILLSAYKVTGRNEFLETARDIILEWALFEKDVWLPKGFLWNDHAVAARILVLSKFWRLYRNHHIYNPDVAKTILQLVARSGKFLAKPSHFTYSTNHGVMQNLALFHLCLCFPSLPDVEQYKRLAFNRLDDQMSFYINEEGIVLEHSAEYQKLGLQLTAMAFRYLTLLNMSIPKEWLDKYEKAKEFYAQLRRPDGSLPTYGDTIEYKDSLGPLLTNIDSDGRAEYLHHQKRWFPKGSNSLYPVAGYSVWWNGLDSWPDEKKLTQTVVVWSNYPGHGHKHADEMSVLLWGGGQTWWTNVGYWTYGTKGRAEAVSWYGSNAPHLIDKDTKSVRNTKLLYYGNSDHLNVIDLERKGPGEYVARRQVIHLKPNLWVIIDHTLGDNNSRTITTWTTSHKVKMSEGKVSGSYCLIGEKNKISLTTFIIASENAKISRYRGNFNPFAGWEANKPTDSIIVEQPANNSWSVAIWSLENAVKPALQFTGHPYMQKWVGPEVWKIVLPLKSGLLTIWRNDDYIHAKESSSNAASKGIKLMKAPSIEDKYAKIRAGYTNAVRKFPKFKDLLSYRWKVTYLLIFVFIVQEVFFFIYKRVKGKHYAGLRILSMLGWAGMIISWFVFLHYKA